MFFSSDVCRVEYSLPTHCMYTIFNSFVQSSCMKTVGVGLQCQLWSIVVAEHVLPAVRHWTTPGQNGHTVEMSWSSSSKRRKRVKHDM